MVQKAQLSRSSLTFKWLGFSLGKKPRFFYHSRHESRQKVPRPGPATEKGLPYHPPVFDLKKSGLGAELSILDNFGDSDGVGN